MLPACCQLVASMWLACCQHVTGMLSACCQHARQTFNYKNKGDLPENFNGYEKGSTEVYKNSKTQHGFIAQEVKAAIDKHSDIKDGFGMWDDDDPAGQQRVGETAVIPMLVKAIQELSAEIDKLKKGE